MSKVCSMRVRLVPNQYLMWIMARKVAFAAETQLKVEGIAGFMERRVVPYGTDAAVICPREFLDRKAYLVITKERWEEGVSEAGHPGRAKAR